MLIINKIKKRTAICVQQKNRLNQRVYNSLSSIFLIKSYARENQEQIALAKQSDLIAQNDYEMNILVQIISVIQEISAIIAIIFLGICFVLLFGGKSVLTVSSFLVFIYLIKRVSDTVNQIGLKFSSVTQRLGELGDITKILEHDEKFSIPDGKKIFQGFNNEIVFKNLDFSYRQNHLILSKINLSVRKGEKLAIVGPTGAGKSTLLHLLLRIYDPDPKSIFIDGEDIREFTFKTLRSKIALVAQHTDIFNDTLKNNICFGMDNISEDEMIEAAHKAQLHDFISQLPDGYNTIVGDNGAQLSGGEKQRVAIARAMLKNAEILIFDEATSSLDVHTEKLIQKAIKELTKDKTSIVVAHRLATVRHCDKIAVLENGNISQYGHFEDLKKIPGKFSEMWNLN